MENWVSVDEMLRFLRSIETENNRRIVSAICEAVNFPLENLLRSEAEYQIVETYRLPLTEENVRKFYDILSEETGEFPYYNDDLFEAAGRFEKEVLNPD